MTNYRKKLLWLYARKRGSGSGGISVSVSGTTPVTLANAIESAIRHMTQFGKLTQSGTPTTANPVDLVCNNGALKWDSENLRIYADGTPEVLTVSADDAEDQTATVENLLAVGPVADEQDIITGKVIRRTEVFKYDGTQQVKPTYLSSTGGKDDGAIIVQPRGAEYAGDVVSFEAEDGKPIDSLKVTLSPKQDLHGYDSPWPAGGGVNLFPTAGNGTISGVTYTTAEDGTVTLNGLCTLSNNIVIATKTLNAGPYSICDFASGTFPDNASARCQVTTAGFYLTIQNKDASDYIGKSTLASDSSVEFRIRLEGGHNYQNCKLKPMVIAGSVSTMTYSPYENSCPITGTDKAEVVRCGKNLWSFDSSYTVSGYTIILNRVAFDLKAGTYTFSAIPNIGSESIVLYGYHADGSRTQIARLYASQSRSSATATIDKDVVSLYFVLNQAGTISDIQLEAGSTATDYELFDPLSTTLEVKWGAVGKNLFKLNLSDGSNGYMSWTANADGTVSVDVTTASAASYISIGTFTLKANTQYTISGCPSGGSASTQRLYFRTTSGSEYDIGNGATIQRSEDTTLTLAIGAGTVGTHLFKPMVCLSTATNPKTYEPYTKTIYGGHLDAVRGEIVLTLKSVDMGSFGWNYITAQGVPFFYAGISDGKQADDFFGLCSQYKTIIGQTAFLASDKSIRMYGASAYNFSRVGVRDTAYTDATAFKSAMQGVQLVYELASPIHIPLSPQTLTALAKNTVWSDAGPVDVLLGDELVEMVAKQPLRTAEGDNTVSVVSEVGEVELAVTYKGGNS